MCITWMSEVPMAIVCGEHSRHTDHLGSDLTYVHHGTHG